MLLGQITEFREQCAKQRQLLGFGGRFLEDLADCDAAARGETGAADGAADFGEL